jgi:hypothetical protein
MSNWLLKVDILLLALTLALAWLGPGFIDPFWNRLESKIRGSPPALTLICVALAPLLIRLAVFPAVGIPAPDVMDEFSYVLGGDTIALGRLANPAPPVPAAFRALYILTTPAYVSIYPPAQAAVLAFGKTIFGQAWWGVFLSIGVMAATGFWMARGFVPRHWAFVGALLTGIQLGALTYWMNSYWGGSVAAVGGNLVMGAYGRLRTRLAAGPACAFSTGAIILGLRRPYEGLVLVLTLGGLLLYELARRPVRPRSGELLRSIAPLVAGAVVFGAFTAWYNLRSTGDWLKSPYQIGVDSASAAPAFVFQSLRPVPNLPGNMARVEEDYRLAVYRRTRTLTGYVSLKAEQFGRILPIYVRPLLLVPLLAGIAGLWLFRCRDLVVVGMVATIALLLEIPGHAHYLAPFVPLYSLQLILGCRALRRWKPCGRAFGLAWSRWLIAAFVLAICISAIGVLDGRDVRENQAEFACCGLNWPHPRDAIETYLKKLPENSLVLVRYGPYNFLHYEYVYNEADLADAKIVWARDLGAGVTEQLTRAFPGRAVWHLDAGILPNQMAVLRDSYGKPIPDVN